MTIYLLFLALLLGLAWVVFKKKKEKKKSNFFYLRYTSQQKKINLALKSFYENLDQELRNNFFKNVLPQVLQ